MIVAFINKMHADNQTKTKPRSYDLQTTKKEARKDAVPLVSAGCMPNMPLRCSTSQGSLGLLDLIAVVSAGPPTSLPTALPHSH